MPPESDDDLRLELARLADEVALLNSHRFVRIHNNVPRLMFFQFLRGLMLGLGTAVGATALVSVAVLVLSQIEFIPILGDLATALIQEIKIEITE
ncbi:MAG: hypothetical protein CMF72_09130 [Mameliella sp.]|nr:hypothetical protein [Mameliella sp.]|tara:strand:- start:367 stop:651 length:285 start_codon:yes stop_codon:yes gene_type:complete